MSRRKKNNQGLKIIVALSSIILVLRRSLLWYCSGKNRTIRFPKTYSGDQPWQSGENKQASEIPETKAPDDVETQSAKMPESGTPGQFERFHTAGSFNGIMILNGEAGIEIRNGNNRDNPA